MISRLFRHTIILARTYKRNPPLSILQSLNCFSTNRHNNKSMENTEELAQKVEQLKVEGKSYFTQSPKLKKRLKSKLRRRPKWRQKRRSTLRRKRRRKKRSQKLRRRKRLQLKTKSVPNCSAKSISESAKSSNAGRYVLSYKAPRIRKPLLRKDPRLRWSQRNRIWTSEVCSSRTNERKGIGYGQPET